MGQPRFRVRSGLNYVVIPEVGRVVAGQILVGGEYLRHCPNLLERLLDAGAAPVVVAPPEPAPAPPVPKPVVPAVVVPDLEAAKDFAVETPEVVEPHTNAEPEIDDEPDQQAVPELKPTAEAGTDGAESAKMEKRAKARRRRG